ncbi:MAG: hypothetical protein WDM71_04415 [Ferruginibacter sp.]
MERVETLLQKLQKQFNEGIGASQLLLTVQMLQHELIHLQNDKEDIIDTGLVTVFMPSESLAPLPIEPEIDATPEEEEKTVEILQVDEAEIEAELEEIKRKAERVQRMSSTNRLHIIFDTAEEDIPTLIHQVANKKTETKEISKIANTEVVSLNDKLKEQKTELSERFNDEPVKDMKKAIGINDRFVYINELFRGDEVMYERSIKTINSFSIWPEAEYWIRRELKIKLGWQDNQAIVKQFDQLVKRRFS